MSQSYIINKFYWGMAWDDYVGSDWSFLYSDNLDFRQNYNWIELVRALQVNWSTWSNSMYWFTETFSGSSKATFAWWEDWKFYNTVWLDLWVTPDASDLYNAQEFGDYIYFAYEPTSTTFDIARITKAEAVTYNTTSTWYTWRVTEWDITWFWTTNASSSIYPMLNYVDEFMLIWVWSRLYKLAAWESAVTSLFDNDLEADIVWITEYSGLFKIYLQSWKIMFWDWQSSVFSAITDIHNTINNVYWYWATDYIIAWANSAYSELHILKGYQAQLLQRVINSERENKDLYAFWGSSTWSRLPQVMAKRLWLLWIWANKGDDTWFYTYWTDVLGTWDAFQLNYTEDDSEEAITKVFGIFPFTAWLYVSYQTWTWDKIWLVDLNVNPSTDKQIAWTLITRVFDAWNRTQTKQLAKIKVKTSNTTSSNYITIKVRRNWGIYEEVWVCNESWTDLYEFTKIIWEFNDIQIQANFVWSWSATPVLEEVNVIYDIIED